MKNMFFCLWHSHVANVPPMEYTADYTVLQSVPGKVRRISTSLIFFFLQLLLLPRTRRGFVVTPFCSLPDFFNSERLMLTNFYEKNYLPLIENNIFYLNFLLSVLWAKVTFLLHDESQLLIDRLKYQTCIFWSGIELRTFHPFRIVVI